MAWLLLTFSIVERIFDFLFSLLNNLLTLASGMDVGQGINVGTGKFDKNNKHVHVIHMSYVVNNHLNDLCVLSNKAVGPGINPKLIQRRAYSGG